MRQRNTNYGGSFMNKNSINTNEMSPIKTKSQFKECSIFDRHLQFMIKSKYMQRNANQESKQDSFNMHFKDPLSPTDLQAQTQEEIFRTYTAFKRPINFMNYSTYDYDLINGQPSPEHLKQFFDKRMDYKQQRQELKLQYDLREDEQKRIGNMTQQKYKENNVMIKDRLKKLKFHILKNIKNIKQDPIRSQSTNSRLMNHSIMESQLKYNVVGQGHLNGFSTQKSSYTGQLHQQQIQNVSRNSYQGGINKTFDNQNLNDKNNENIKIIQNAVNKLDFEDIYQNLFTKSNNPKVVPERVKSTDLDYKKKVNGVINLKRNSALPLTSTQIEQNIIKDHQFQPSQDAISLMGQRKIIKKHQFSQEEASNVQKQEDNSYKDDLLSIRSRLTKTNLEILQKGRKDIKSQLSKKSRIGGDTFNTGSDYFNIRAMTVKSREDRFSKLSQPEQGGNATKNNQDAASQIGKKIEMNITITDVKLDDHNKFGKNSHNLEEVEDDDDDEFDEIEELENRYEMEDEVKTLNGHEKAHSNDKDETSTIFSLNKSVGGQSIVSNKSGKPYSDKSAIKINSLEKQLEKEKKEREKLLKIIEKLKDDKQNDHQQNDSQSVTSSKKQIELVSFRGNNKSQR
ncbi:UNKNOWN [Stylonychia lemnae]|uniref:Uncharacterized protein n=1 Tax=Stylonychia lemnae TaxID=5949 RepID=A0A078A791_STYLE|nr:UNKNOWN [Stylonychia lemnae]|eukprot:CDW78120.1 UNKNOWN [Stylonychia lemnae]